MSDFFSEAPSWLKDWPDKAALLAMFPAGVKIFYTRNKRKMKIGQLRFDDNGFSCRIDRFKCSWQFRGGEWRLSCNCGMKNGVCPHNYAAAMQASEMFKGDVLNRSGSSKPKPKSEFRHSAQPVQKDLFTLTPSYVKDRPVNVSNPVRELSVEADFKTSPGFVLIRYYDDSKSQRRLLKLSEVYNQAVTANLRSARISTWCDDDMKFLSWMRSRMDYKKSAQYAKMTALKITRIAFDNWLCHWRELQPGRFIERDSQQAVTGGDNSIKIRFELSEENDRTTIAAIAVFPDGSKSFFHEIAREMSRQQKAAGEDAINFDREYLLNGSICTIDFPLNPATIWELFHKKNPSMGSEHVCKHLPVLLENRIDLLGGPAVEQRSQLGTLSLKARVGGDSLLLTPLINGKPLADSVSLSRVKSGFVVNRFESEFVDDFNVFLGKIVAQKKGDIHIVKLTNDMLENLVANWDLISDKVKLDADEASRVLLTVTEMSPVLNVKSNDRWVDLFSSWHSGENSVYTESINYAIVNKKNFLRSREGSWIRLDLEKVASAFADLESSGLSFGFQRHVPSEAVKLLENEDLAPIFSLDAKETLQEIKSSLRQSYELSGEFGAVLRAYQQDGFEFLRQMDLYQIGCILADDMGLGKTVQILALLHSSTATGGGPSLVCAPASVINVWLSEASKFAPSLRVAVAHGTTASRKQVIKSADSYDLIITSYGSMRNDVDLLLEQDFNFLLLDEAQYIRNPMTKVYKAVCRLRARQRIAITGTPVENHATDLWSIVNFLNPGFLGRLDEFREAYETVNDREARKVLAARIAPLLLRRTKELVARELPPKTVETIVVEMDPDQRRFYQTQLDQLRAMAKSPEKNSIKLLALLTRLRQICCSPQLLDLEAESSKLKCMLEMIEEITSEGHSVLVFSSFTSMLDIVQDRLDDRGLPWRMITGQTPVSKRPEIVRQFNESNQSEVFLLSLKAAGTGLTLTKADYVFIYDPWWNPAAENQAIDRTHRIGQDKPVIAYKMVAQGTIEEEILKLQAKKQELFDDIVAESDSVSANISEELIASLMQSN